MGAHSLSPTLVLGIVLTCCMQLATPCFSQDNSNPPTNEPSIQAADCPPLTAFPPLVMTIVVSCQKSDSVEITMPLKPDPEGRSREKTIRGAYEFREYRMTQAGQAEHAFDNLMQLIPMAGFTVKYSASPSIITARNGDTWILINVSGDSYNVNVVRESQMPCTRVNSVEEISRGIQAHGRVAIYGIQFSLENQAIQEKRSEILKELLKYLQQNPSLSVLIESHKVSTTGTEDDDLEITRERANAVVDWLVAHGIPAARLQAKPFGRMQPVTENDSPMEIQCNERIELSKAVQ